MVHTRLVGEYGRHRASVLGTTDCKRKRCESDHGNNPSKNN